MNEMVWMITGASRGLGAEIAKAALAAGEKVIATGRGRDGLNFSSDQDALYPVEMDVTNEARGSRCSRWHKPVRQD
jgi:NADP-dependent 3-hydroxy acid dehydrogenase YdfG